MLCSNCCLKNAWNGYELCEDCFNTVMVASELVQYNYTDSCIIPEEKEEAEYKFAPEDQFAAEDPVECMKNAKSVNEYLVNWHIMKDFIAYAPPINGIHHCPLCGVSIIIEQENCKVFRCAQLANGQYVNPHATLEEMIAQRQNGTLISGCMIPLDSNNSDRLRIPIKNGLPWYY